MLLHTSIADDSKNGCVADYLNLSFQTIISSNIKTLYP